MTKFLQETEIIDFSNKEIENLAKDLAHDCKIDEEMIDKLPDIKKDDIT